MSREDLLDKLTVRLTHIAEDSDPSLAKLLENIRLSIRKEDDEKLAELSGKLAQVIILKESPSPVVEKQNLLNGHVLEFSQSVKLIKVEKPYRSQLAKLADQLCGTQHFDQQVQSIREIFKLINTAVNDSASKKPTSGNGWFSKKSSGNDQAWQVFLGKSTQLLKVVLNHIDTLKGDMTDTNHLKENLDESVAVDGVQDVLVEVVELLKSITVEVGEERETTQNFLGGLREQLLNVEETIFSVISDDKESLGRAEVLGQQVSDDVENINKAVEDDDLVALKKTVESGLTSLSDRVTNYLVKEQEHHKSNQTKVNDLSRQVRKMEVDTINLRGLLKSKQDLAVKDPLTGVYNRAGYQERITEEIARMKRINSPFSVVFVDCNKFKIINDTYGHSAGDTVLVKVAEALTARARSSDIVARYGGDEFVILLPNTPIDGAETFAKDATKRVEEAGFNDNGKPLDVSISCGVTEARESDTELTVLQRADEAMYKAKKLTGEKVFVTS